ncbi:MAG: hypothetical protein WCB27_25670 [Thermoguttaceae bacterium]
MKHDDRLTDDLLQTVFGELGESRAAATRRAAVEDAEFAAAVEGLQAAVAALRAENPGEVGDGFNERLRQRITQILGSIQTETAPPVLPVRSLTTWRWIMRSPVSRVAAAIVLVLAIAGVALWFHGAGASYAFADFVKPILEVKTVKYKQTTEIKGPPAMTVISEWMIRDATRSRSEIRQPGGEIQSVEITDWSKGVSLCLIPATKHATILEYRDTKNARNDPAMWLHLLQMARDNKTAKFHCEPLGEKNINGRRGVGFRIGTDQGVSEDLWGDPQTGLPIRVEMTTGTNGNLKATMTDFVFNATMDESLFSVEPPAGYTVDRQKADTTPDEEKDLIEMFRQYAKLTGGAFPNSLDLQAVTWEFWKTYNIQAMWDNIAGAAAGGNVAEGRRREFEERVGKIMDKINDATMAGKTNEEQTRELTAEMSRIVSQITYPAVTRMTWESFAPAKFKATEEQKRQFEKQMQETLQGGPGKEQAYKRGEEVATIIMRMVWQDLAPAKLKANEEKRCKFEELMRKMDGKASEKRIAKQRFREIFGDQMLKDVEAWQAEVVRSGKAREARDARTRKTAKDREATSQKFMEAQRRVGRGLDFANSLPPAADAHYAGKGIKIGAADTPILWYRPAIGKKYRVIYADLAVRDADTPPKRIHNAPIAGSQRLPQGGR